MSFFTPFATHRFPKLFPVPYIIADSHDLRSVAIALLSSFSSNRLRKEFYVFDVLEWQFFYSRVVSYVCKNHS